MFDYFRISGLLNIVKIEARHILGEYSFSFFCHFGVFGAVSNGIQGLPREDPGVFIFKFAKEEGSAAVDNRIVIIIRLKNMVITPNWLKLAKFELESTVVGFWLELAGFSFGLLVLENAALGVVVLPLDIAKAFVVHIILILFLIFHWIRKDSHFNLRGLLIFGAGFCWGDWSYA